MFVSVRCQSIDKRSCYIIVEKGKEEMKITLKIPFFKSEKAIWTAIHKAKKKIQKEGFDEVTGSQISSALTSEYPEIPYVYY